MTDKDKINTQPGTGLTIAGTYLLAGGPSENVEWHIENQRLGFTYYDTTNHVYRTFTDSGWVTLSTN